MIASDSKNSRTYIPIIWLLLVVILLVMLKCSNRNDIQNDPSILVGTVLSSGHGLVYDPDNEKRIKAIRDDFDRYAPIFRNELEMPRDLRRLTIADRQNRYELTLITLQEIGNRKSSELIASSVRESAEYLSKEWATFHKYERGESGTIPPVALAMSNIFNEGVEGLAALKDPTYVDEAFGLLERASLATTENLLEYIAACATSDDAIKAKLEIILADENSRPNSHPILKEFVARVIKPMVQ